MTTFLARIRMGTSAGAEVAKVAIIHKNHILIGRRTDDGRYDFPGGHAESNETGEEAAHRETYEESGIRVPTLAYMGSTTIQNSKGETILVTGFRYDAPLRMPAVDTPEMKDWKWVLMEPDQPLFDQKHWHNVNDFMLKKLGIR